MVQPVLQPVKDSQLFTVNKKHEVFIPDRFFWVIIKNKHYDKLRQLPGWEKFKDIPYVDDDAIRAMKGFKELGAIETDIIVKEDATRKEFKQIMKRIEDKINKNWYESNLRSFCFVYYAGHGVMNTMTYAVCNVAVTNEEKNKQEKVIYPLQQRLKSLSELPGAYVCGIFDCCREPI